MEPSNLPIFLRHASDPILKVYGSIGLLLGIVSFIYSVVKYKKTNVKSKTRLIASSFLLAGMFLMYIQSFFIVFWYEHYALYLFQKVTSAILVLIGVYYVFKSNGLRVKKDTTEKLKWSDSFGARVIISIATILLTLIVLITTTIMWLTFKHKVKYNAKYFNYASGYLYKGEYDKAIADFSKSIGINSLHVDSYIGRGYAYYAKGEYDKAIADFNKALTLNPHLVDVYILRGNSFSNKEQYQTAIHDYTKALKINPNRFGAYSGRAYALMECGKNKTAVKDFNKALKLDQKYAQDYFLGLAIISLREKRIKDARDYFGKAINLEPALKNGVDAIRDFYTEKQKQEINELIKLTVFASRNDTTGEFKK